ncbi:hypothetical protein [Corynebacterium sp. ES2715-CONJ3]|uniref:hypothetical protein n=1 Tax=Corynebacterium sp. ES2715-CONJ3 TaxID=2974028 RepID=UPI0021685644|nr:hypothetical protein [Corynebacterium sp. ES2715-CONJ3]MCS4490992.1 hypothetical protein [Corynebacterium sp. ES2715-CONJ3]
MTDKHEPPLGEDPGSEGFQHPESAQPYSENPYGYYGDGTSAGFSDPVQDRPDKINPYTETRMVTRDKGLDIMMAFSYAFKATFAKPLLWIGGAALFLLLSLIVGIAYGVLGFYSSGGMIADPNAVDGAIYEVQAEDSLSSTLLTFGISLIIAALSPFLLALLLDQIDGRPLSWAGMKERTNYVPVFLVALLVSLIIQVPTLLIQVALGANSSTMFVDPETGLPTVAIGALITTVLVSNLWLFIASLFLSFCEYLVADRRDSVIGSIGTSISIVLKNFFPVLGATLLIGLVAGLGTIVTCGLGAVILLPAIYHFSVHMYRQLAHGEYPEM